MQGELRKNSPTQQNPPSSISRVWTQFPAATVDLIADERTKDESMNPGSRDKSVTERPAPLNGPKSECPAQVVQRSNAFNVIQMQGQLQLIASSNQRFQEKLRNEQNLGQGVSSNGGTENSKPTCEENQNVLLLGKGCNPLRMNLGRRFYSVSDIIDQNYWNTTELTATSRKVFIGGIPTNTAFYALFSSFNRYGQCSISCPNKELTFASRLTTGYAFVIYKSQKMVQRLLGDCIMTADGRYMFSGIFEENNDQVMVEVKPWFLIETMAFYHNNSRQADVRLILFVGGIPRSIKARELAQAVEQAFPGVVFVVIDLDAHVNYPKGVAKVCFDNAESFRKALKARFVSLKYCGVEKIIEFKPNFNPNQLCEICFVNNKSTIAVVYCADPMCMKYFCADCWTVVHHGKDRGNHTCMKK